MCLTLAFITTFLCPSDAPREKSIDSSLSFLLQYTKFGQLQDGCNMEETRKTVHTFLRFVLSYSPLPEPTLYKTLLCACCYGIIEAVESALEHGAPLSCKSAEETALQVCIQGIQYFWVEDHPETSLHIARLLVQYGADVNETHKPSLSPLGLAISEDNIPLVLFLLQEGAERKELYSTMSTSSQMSSVLNRARTSTMG